VRKNAPTKKRDRPICPRQSAQNTGLAPGRAADYNRATILIETKKEAAAMLQIYHGDGKGKTTAAFGLALRAAGRGRRVIIAQFLKGEDTGERRSMELVPRVLLLPLPEKLPFVWQMNVIERAEYESLAARMLSDAVVLAERDSVVVLDEVLGALETDILRLEDVLECLDQLNADCEVVLTGRNCPKELLDRADYITHFQAQRHPYDQGIPAREGLEF
jgi:cob(I)alamin adenosyltransferase